MAMQSILLYLWDLPYYERMRAKTHYENKLHENKYENHVSPLP